MKQEVREKVCWVVGAGSFDGLMGRPQKGDLVIAADGGYIYLKELGIEPDVLLGDFDSLKRVPEHEHLLRHSPIKDDTDMALAVAYAHRNRAIIPSIFTEGLADGWTIQWAIFSS